MKPQEQMYVSAIRYALNRKTYIAGVTVDFMLKQELSAQCKHVIERDLTDAMSRPLYDRDVWENLLEYITK